MSIPFTQLVAAEQQAALVTVVVDRLADLGLLVDEAVDMETEVLVRRVMAEEAVTTPVAVVGKAIAGKVAETACSISSSVRSAARRHAPSARKASRAAADAVTKAGTFVIEVSREAVDSIGAPITRPACPKCGEPTTIKRNRTSGEPFAACTAWETSGCNFVSGIRLTD